MAYLALNASFEYLCYWCTPIISICILSVRTEQVNLRQTHLYIIHRKPIYK